MEISVVINDLQRVDFSIVNEESEIDNRLWSLSGNLGFLFASCSSSRLNENIVMSFVFYEKLIEPPCFGDCLMFRSRVFEVGLKESSTISLIYEKHVQADRIDVYDVMDGLGVGYIYLDYEDNINGRLERELELMVADGKEYYLPEGFTRTFDSSGRRVYYNFYPYFTEERILEGMREKGWCASEGFDLQVLEQEYSDYDSEQRRDIGFLNMVLSELPLNKSRVTSYNNIAYYLEQSGHYESAIFLLNKIVKKVPNRTVAYINLGDAHWGAEHPELAREAYQTYIHLMRESNREQRIPQKVFDRVAK